MKYTSRKLIMTAGLTVLFTTLLVQAHIDQNIYNSLTIFLWGGYVAGNIGEHFKPK